MAEKRMFSEKVTNSDLFLDMPLSTQALYFHLNMSADDDGFLDNPRMVMRMIGAGEDDMKLLIAKGLVITWENSAVIVIKDWRIHNTIRKDRKKDTIHTNEFKKLKELSNGSYQKVLDDRQPLGNQVTTKCQPKLVSDIGLENEKHNDISGFSGLQPNDNQMTTKCPPRLVEVSIDKVSIDKSSRGKSSDDDGQLQQSFEEFNLHQYMQDAFGRMMNGIEQQTLNYWLNDYDVELIKEAVKIAVLNNAYSLKYIESILIDWETNKITNVAMVREREKKRDKAKQKNRNNNYNGSVRKESLPDWVDEDVSETPVSAETEAEFQRQLAELRQNTKEE